MTHTVHSIFNTKKSSSLLVLGWLIFVFLIVYLYSIPATSLTPPYHLLSTTNLGNFSQSIPVSETEGQNYYLTYRKELQKYSLRQIFQQLSDKLSQISNEEIEQIFQLSESERLKHLLPDDHFKVSLDRVTGKVKEIRHSRIYVTAPYHYELSTLLLNPSLLNTWSIQPHSSTPKMMIHYGIIQIDDHGLASSAENADIPQSIIRQLVEILAWDIDLTTTQKGDTFSLAWEMHEWEMGIEKPTFAPGAIVYANFKRADEKNTLVRYYRKGKPLEPEYFTSDGNATKKAFLRVPLKNNFIISSGYNLTRFHPVLHKIIAHKGTDYSAKANTEVRVTGKGTVEYVGWEKSGYGNVVIVSHGSGYHTKYAHLNKFVPNLRRKQIVEQGEVIAYVGSTGLSTAPHLHYEFLVDGEHTDPVKVTLPNAQPLIGLDLHGFQLTLKHYQSIFDMLQAGITLNKTSDYLYSNIEHE